MFERIFGGTDAEQMEFLQIRSIVTIAAVALSLVAAIFAPEALGIVGAVMLFVWGFGVLKAMFGITAIGILFSGNVVLGVILFLLYLMAAYFAGLVFAFVGVGRWIYLKVKYSNHG